MNDTNKMVVTLAFAVLITTILLFAVAEIGFEVIEHQQRQDVQALYNLTLILTEDYDAISDGEIAYSGLGQRRLRFIDYMETALDIHDTHYEHCWDAYQWLKSDYPDPLDTYYELSWCSSELAVALFHDKEYFTEETEEWATFVAEREAYETDVINQFLER